MLWFEGARVGVGVFGRARDLLGYFLTHLVNVVDGGGLVNVPTSGLRLLTYRYDSTPNGNVYRTHLVRYSGVRVTFTGGRDTFATIFYGVGQGGLVHFFVGSYITHVCVFELTIIRRTTTRDGGVTTGVSGQHRGTISRGVVVIYQFTTLPCRTYDGRVHNTRSRQTRVLRGPIPLVKDGTGARFFCYIINRASIFVVLWTCYALKEVWGKVRVFYHNSIYFVGPTTLF